MIGFGITGNAGFDFFIAQSAEYKDLVIKEFNEESPNTYIDDILYRHKLTRADFTDSDWKILSQYLEG